jgi:hypothetical protein
LVIEYRGIHIEYEEETETQATFEHLPPDREDLSDWSSDIGARSAMTVLAKWAPEKFVKKRFLTLCVTFEDSKRFNSYRKKSAVRSAPQELRDYLAERWEKHEILAHYQVDYMPSDECAKTLEQGADNFDNYKKRSLGDKRKEFSEFFIEANVMEHDAGSADAAKPVLHRYAQPNYDLAHKAIDVAKQESWKEWAEHVGRQIEDRWSRITNRGATVTMGRR